MAINVLRPAQWQTQHWQNGGGITHQLCRADDENGLLWRLSIAEVASDGPFSRFDNIDRIILLLEGAGFTLHESGGMANTLSSALQPYQFAGETPIQCRLIDGPVRDFNVMTRRHDVAPALDVLTLGTDGVTIAPAPYCFVYVVSGSICATLSQQHLRLNTADLLCLTNETQRCLLSSTTAAQVLFITIK